MEESFWRCKERPAESQVESTACDGWMISFLFCLISIFTLWLIHHSLIHLFIHPFTHSSMKQINFFKPKMHKYMTSSLCLRNWIQQESAQMLRLKLVSWFLLGLNERGCEMQIGLCVPSIENCYLCGMGMCHHRSFTLSS